MKRKKILSLLLCAALAAAMLAGCADPAAQSSQPPAGSQQPNNTPAASAPPEGTSPVGEGIQMPAGFDSSNINWIVPAAAGSAVDLITRGVADAIGKDLGANINVENLAGASQTIGAAEFSIRNADGHNLLTIANACYFTQPLLT